MKIYPFKKIVFNCKGATQRYLKKEEGRISLQDRLKLWYHLLYCDPCRRFIEQSKLLRKSAQTLKDSFLQQPPFTLSEESREKIRKQMDEFDQ